MKHQNIAENNQIPDTATPTATTQEKRAPEYRRLKFNNLRYLMAVGLAVGLVLHGLIRYGSSYNIGIGKFIFGEPVAAAIPRRRSQQAIEAQNKQPVPHNEINGAPAPDWSNITFEDMKFGGSGSVDFPYIQNPGMKETRIWSAGQSAADVLELGDFEESEFNIENFTLEEIADITSINLDNFTLSDFEMLQWQTLHTLVLSIPDLKDRILAEIPPLQELASIVIGNLDITQTIGQVLSSFPELAEAELSKYVNLDKYKLTDIPGIEQARLKDFTNWQNTVIAKVPGLAKVPFDQFPSQPSPDLSSIALVDLPLGSLEGGRTKSISGSYQAGFNVPCLQKCGHIEVAGDETLTGSQWMSGKDQKVKGGFGILGQLNSGEEPTGRHPFGKSFKQVIWNIDEASGSIETAMFFRICKRGFVDLGCSPYFIGPVPFFTYREMDPIILGVQE